jgi:hypothetical protein
MKLTTEQMAGIESKYRGYKVAYCSDLPLDTSPPVRVLTADEVARIESRIGLLKQVAQGYYARRQEADGSIVNHLIGELIGRLNLNKRMLEVKSAEELKRWNSLSDAAKSYENMVNNHPEWRVQSNPLLDMTGSILEESQSTDVQIIHNAVMGAILMRTMEVFRAPSPPMPSRNTPRIVPRIVANGAKAIVGPFRKLMARVEQQLIARGATSEAAKVRVLTEEELSMSMGGGTANPLTPTQIERAIALLRAGHNVHVESMGQMRQIQGELGQLGVRSEGSSNIIPQRPAVGTGGSSEIPGSFRDGPGTFRVDPPHAPGKIPYHPHNEYPHINMTLRNGKTLDVVVTGSKSF